MKMQSDKVGPYFYLKDLWMVQETRISEGIFARFMTAVFRVN